MRARVKKQSETERGNEREGARASTQENKSEKFRAKESECERSRERGRQRETDPEPPTSQKVPERKGKGYRLSLGCILRSTRGTTGSSHQKGQSLHLWPTSITANARPAEQGRTEESSRQQQLTSTVCPVRSNRSGFTAGGTTATTARER